MNCYKEHYGYEWVDELIHYCSDPFNHFPDQHRLDRAFGVLIGISKYDILGEKLLMSDESLRLEFKEYLVNLIKIDNKEKSDRDFDAIRNNIENIILNKY